MNRSTNIWSTAVAAAALFALPIAASAQTPPTTQPPTTQPPTTQPQTTQPPTTQPPTTQPPTTAQPPTQAADPASAQPDQTAAKQHLTAARDSLSQLTSLPEAAKLQGESRTQVTQLISNFNELITTQANWRASYDKVNANLTALLGPDSPDPASTAGTAGAVGTSGAAIATGELDPAIRTKLADFRKHLKAFEQAAGGAQPAAASDTMPPANATGSTSNPANPAQATQPPPPASATGAGVTGATGTSGMTPAADQAKAVEQAGHAEADKHLDAISAILEQSKTGALTKAQTTELKKHVAELRKLLQQPK
jgi:hypothetical protein